MRQHSEALRSTSVSCNKPVSVQDCSAGGSDQLRGR